MWRVPNAVGSLKIDDGNSLLHNKLCGKRQGGNAGIEIAGGRLWPVPSSNRISEKATTPTRK